MVFTQNNLNKAHSPYLQQHKNNPIWWQEWGKDVLDYTLVENKIIFTSIGYSTCHWCHVMAQEAFSDNKVADYINANFVSIKVDREKKAEQAFCCSVSMAELAILRADLLCKREYTSGEFSEPVARDFFNIAVLMRNSFFHLLETPVKIAFSRLPGNTVQIRGKECKDCYFHTCISKEELCLKQKNN